MCTLPGFSLRQWFLGLNLFVGMHKYELILSIHITEPYTYLVKVLFPSGPKVTITRNHWGLDITIKTPRPNDINNEKGLCLYSGPNVKAQVDMYGYNLR